MTPTPSKPEASLRERIADQMALVRMMRGDAPMACLRCGALSPMENADA